MFALCCFFPNNPSRVMACVATELSTRDDRVLRTMSVLLKIVSVSLCGDASTKPFEDVVKNPTNVLESIRVLQSMYYLCMTGKHPWANDLCELMKTFGTCSDTEERFYHAYVAHVRSHGHVDKKLLETQDGTTRACMECYALCYHETVSSYIESMLDTSSQEFMKHHQQHMPPAVQVSWLTLEHILT